MINEVEPTFLVALKTWWAWVWRTMLTVVVLSFLVGLIIGFIGVFAGLAQETVSPFAGISGAAIGLYFSIFFIKRLMVKGFGKYRLAVVHKD